jgi:hypothetical protein
MTAPSTGDHGNIAFERRGKLDAYVIMVAVEAAPAILILGIQPMLADDGEHDVTLRDLRVELLDEVHAGLHGVDIHEDAAAREIRRQVIEQAPGNTRRIFTAIIDEDPRHGEDFPAR